MDVPAALAAASSRTQGLGTFATLLGAGVPRAALSRAVAAGDVVRVRRRVYALTPLPPVPRFLVTADGVDPRYVARVRAVLMSLGPGACAAGRTAAALLGWGMLVEPGRTIDVAVRHGHGSSVRSPGVVVRQARGRDVVRRRVLPGTADMRLTAPVQTVLDCARSLPLLQAVVIADSALRSGDVTVAELRAVVGRIAGRPGAARLRRVVELCDPESGSVLESVLRVRLHLAGITGWASQVTVRALPPLRVDFCFAAAGLVVEADGARWHPEPSRDRLRDNALAIQGWRVLRYSWADVVHDHRRVVAEVAEASTCGTPILRGVAEGDRLAA